MVLSRREFVVRSVAFASIYFLLAFFSLQLFSLGNAQVSPVWLPAGLALFVLVRFGWRYVGAVFLGALATNLFISGELLSSVGIAVGNSAEAVIGWYFFRSFRSWPAIFGFMWSCCLAAAAVSASNGVFWIDGGWSDWLNWWLGDASGILVFFPALIRWRRSWLAIKQDRLWAAGLLFGTILLSLLVFSYLSLSLAYLVVVPLMVAQWKFGISGGFGLLTVIMMLAAVQHQFRIGPFGDEGVLSTQYYILYLSVLLFGTHLVIRNLTTSHN